MYRSLFQRRVSFLGHVLSGDGIGVQAEKVKAVRDWPVPKNISELRSYLGMVSYYRKFIPGFANIATPLHRLLRKSSMYEWGPGQMNASILYAQGAFDFCTDTWNAV